MTYATYAELEQDHLYGGGLQAQVFPECIICGGDVGDDALETDDGYVCSECLTKRAHYYSQRIWETAEKYVSGKFDAVAMAQALSELAEEIEDVW